MNELRVSIARHAVAAAPARLMCIGVGSCVIIMIRDTTKSVGALAHVLLPAETDGGATSTAHPARYANTAVPLLVHALKARGAHGPYVAKLAGGAGLFADVLTPKGRIGERNVDAARTALAEAGIAIASEDVGGGSGRSIVFDIDTGNVAVRLAGGDTRVT
ncbi:MAG: chemotaxis protein CheD [Gemmatimonadetes bacterium]|nr:chemotaxis protein CheD [Gemmatimonadota bacterium]